jgi:hypothetical protein
MAGFRIPGPLGLEFNNPIADSGTLAVTAMPPPSLMRTRLPAQQALSPALTREGESRALTAGEVAMSKLVFADSVDYSKVRVHNGEYLWFGLQDDDTAMTPNGEMYFNPKRFKEDFSASVVSDRHWFMHEMVHVWQHQLGYSVRWNGMQRWKLQYSYSLEADKRLGDYDMEQQGQVIADYFAIHILKAPTAASTFDYQTPEGQQLYLAVLADFLGDPSSKSNLPK